MKILPCFTPNELKELGVTYENATFDFETYDKTGQVNEEEYYKSVRSAISDYYEGNCSDNNILCRAGWSPLVINITPDIIAKTYGLSKAKLIGDGYKIDDTEIIDLT